MSDVDHGVELKMLGRALEAERKTSSFYKKMVAELPVEGQKLFQRFVEIEEGHVAIVQAEMDAVTGGVMRSSGVSMKNAAATRPIPGLSGRQRGSWV